MTANDDFLSSPAGRGLAWLADAPLFIDADQIAALYNAVARPEYKTEKITLTLKDSKQFQVEGKAAVKGELSAAAWLKTIFPFLDAKVEASAEGGAGVTLAKEKGDEIEMRPIDTPQRQLVQLALHYFLNLPERTHVVTGTLGGKWLDSGFVSAVPRSLVFVDFPARTAFVPMAAEVEGGRVLLIYGDLANALVGPKDRARIPHYPDPASFQGNEADLKAKRQEYWQFFRDNFNSTLAMESVERSVSESGRMVRWIDYRVPLGEGMPYVHLSVAPQGRYDTGVFAYRFIKRGFKHGLRVVGTMKSEPAMNVLAIFER